MLKAPVPLIDGRDNKCFVGAEPSIVYFNIVDGALLCLCSQKTSMGGALYFKGNGSIAGAKNDITKLIADLEGASGKNRNEFIAKIVGSNKQLEELRSVLAGENISVAGFEENKGNGLEAFFYTESGRLRIAQSSASQEPPAPQEPSQTPVKRKKVRVLIVDDSKTIRNLLTHILSADPDLEVVGAAELPSQVEPMIRELKPDVMTLDIQMPEMTGVELLEKILPRYLVPTVMFSSTSMEEGGLVFRALEIGAVDYIRKPALEDLKAVAPTIVERVKTAATVRVRANTENNSVKARLAVILDQFARSTVIAMGASTGGTEALRKILMQLPSEIPPIVVVQHIPPVFSAAFAKRLDDICPFDVAEASDGDELRAGRVLIAPGGMQMSVEGKKGIYRVRIQDAPPVNRHRPSVDVLFDSVAATVKEKAIGVLLTGMGIDGAQGLLKMRKAGAQTIAQDEESSVVFGMPREAIRLGAAGAVLPIDQIAEALVKILQLKKAS
jgi:two-component system chemotaxis response regulator CheB